MTSTPITIIGRFNGPAKAVARDHKLKTISQLADPYLLTLPGDAAHLELALMTKGLARDHIVGIQRAGKFDNYDGSEVLRALLKATKNKAFPIFIRDFKELPQYFGAQYYDELREGEVNHLLPRAHSFADWIWDHGTASFSAADIDLCGPFHPPMAKAICALFSSRLMASTGHLFITHLKGREKYTGLIELIPWERQTRLSRWYYSIPCYYMDLISHAGYLLTLERLIEYRDEGRSPMLQYHFSFDKKAMINQEDLKLGDVEEKLAKAHWDGQHHILHENNYDRLILN